MEGLGTDQYEDIYTVKVERSLLGGDCLLRVVNAFSKQFTIQVLMPVTACELNALRIGSIHCWDGLKGMNRH